MEKMQGTVSWGKDSVLFKVQGSKFKVQGLKFKVQGSKPINPKLETNQLN
jgi:hypothetical protein